MEPDEYQFDVATRATPVSQDPPQAEFGRWAVELTDLYNIGPVPNGGYQTAVMSRTTLATAGGGDLLNLSCYFLSPVKPGPATVEVERVKPGRSMSVYQATLVQDGRARARQLMIVGDLDALEGPTEEGPAPTLPPRERCVALDAAFAGAPGILKNVHVAVDPATAAFVKGETGTPPELRAHLMLADGRPTDVLALTLFADTLPPTTFNSLGINPWVPTLELTTQIRRRPAPGPVRVQVVTRHVTRGHFEEDGELWDAEDQLVAVFRQRAMLLAPRS